DVGEWSGLTWAEIGERFPEGAARHGTRGHGWEHGESYEQMAERVVVALLQIAERHEGDRVIIVVHGGTMRAGAARLAEGRGAGRRRYVTARCVSSSTRTARYAPSARPEGRRTLARSVFAYAG